MKFDWEKKIRLEGDSNPWPLRYQPGRLCSTSWAIKPTGNWPLCQFVIYPYMGKNTKEYMKNHVFEQRKKRYEDMIHYRSRALDRCRRGHVLESRLSLNFFQSLISQLLKLCIELCWSIMSSYLSPQFKYIKLLIFVGKKNSLYPKEPRIKGRFTLLFRWSVLSVPMVDDMRVDDLKLLHQALWMIIPVFFKFALKSHCWEIILKFEVPSSLHNGLLCIRVCYFS